MLRDDVFPVLFGALSIDRVENIDGRNTGSAPKMRWVYAVSQLEWNEDADYPNLYRLVSLMPLVDEEGLRQVTNQSLSEEVREWYLQLPDGLPGRVAELAEEVTASSPTLYDKARALENYLKTNYAYDNKPDTSAGASEDFVDRFLFEIREGYCDYFSTAMVVMARSIGLPARWVKGFASGYLPAEIDPSGMTIPPGATDPDGAGTYLVRNADAHSWAEIYFEGYGWIPFEPTPGFSMPYAFPEGEEPPEWVTAAVPAANDNPPSEEKSRVSSAWWMAAAAAVILAALGFVAFRSRKVLRRWYGRNVPETDRNRRVVYEVERLFRYLGRKGLRREEHETVRETMLRWEGSHRWLKGDLERLFDLFEKAKYGKGQISEEEMHVVLGKVQKLREELR
jgi:transglutaminase-like putative cysteine protease